MKAKYFWGIILICFLVAAAIGLFKKQNYTDWNKQGNIKENVGDCMVGVLVNTLIEPVRNMGEILPQSPIILKVKGTGRIRFGFHLYKQEVEVEEVYKGEGIKTGDVIDVTDIGLSLLEIENMPLALNMSFVNFLQEGKEYLLFLGEKPDAEVLTKNNHDVYFFAETIVLPVFCLEDVENDLALIDLSADDMSFPYRNMKQNEFFAAQQEVLDALLDVKHKLLEQYVFHD